jgi:hypothetical protein
LAASSAALALALIVAAAPSVSLAAQGDCGQPVSNGGLPTATDCLFILRAAVGSSTCDPVCICDLNGSTGNPNATDALTCLNVAVGNPSLLNCDCGTTTTTVTVTSTTSTTTVPPTSTTSTTIPDGGGACPDTVELTVFGKITGDCSTNDDCEIGTCDTGLSRCRTVTVLDTGWTGISHDADVNDQQQVIATLDCGAASAPCGVCNVTGIDPTNRMCRCESDNRQICNEPFVADNDDCGGAVCNCYLGPPLPLSAGNTPACVVNRLGEDLSGTTNVDTGDGAGPVRLRSVVYLGIDVFTPCPYCGSGCTAPALNLGVACTDDADCDTSQCSLNAGIPCQSDADCLPDAGTCVTNGDGVCGSADTTVGDGVRDGTCVGDGANNGLPCDVDAINTSFPWINGVPGGGSSLDCFPASNKNVSGTGLRIDLNLTTASQQLTAAVPCGFPPFAPDTCTCGVCTGDASLPCSSDTVCADAGAGTCAALGTQRAYGDQCAGAGVCNDAGGGEGLCAEGPDGGFCDAALRSDGEPFVACQTNADCAVFTQDVGLCTLIRGRECFLSTISAQGDADPDYPVGVATFCIAQTTNGGINSVAGLPGPGRVTNQGRTRKFCGGIGGTEYVENAGCP